ncbi:hypothetical protein RIF29_10100 [Crotalaria pallida]|uniref:Pentatricopeptide repeat-containing protein n=1 Tax=Crotalaria pallida TaxID=3830 RepID=A0AAN9FSK1_CROPI
MNELVQEASDSDRVRAILDEKFYDLIMWSQQKQHPTGSASLKLLKQLDSWPALVVQYSKGIKAAGRSRNVDLATQLFKEAANRGIVSTNIYNALMGAFMFNGLAERGQSLFCEMKRDATCTPTIATYNILISVFGRLMLIDYMEATFKEINELSLSLNVNTYNHLIAGYISAWMWDDMEKLFLMLKSAPVKPDLKTYVLMLRGYVHSGNLEKMEEIYSLIEALLKFIPKEEYRPWLNVLLIRLYAQEDWLEEMDNAINEAFEHRTHVTTTKIMRCITTTYFQCNAVDRLESFVRRAECAGWRIRRSIYHCKLVLYASQKRIKEMENVLNEMGGVNLLCTKKTLWIMYKAYMSCGQRSVVLKILGQMYKHGHEVPLEAFPS